MATAANAFPGEWGQRPLDSDYQALADNSGIRPEWVDRAGVRRVTDREGQELVGRRGGNCAGLLFPFYLPGQKTPRAYCLRRDYPDVEYNAAGDRRETAKYLFHAGSKNLLYFVPSTSPEFLQDTSLPIVITEGIKKALALEQTAWDDLPETAEKPRFIAISQNGVWGHRGKIETVSDQKGGRQVVKGIIADYSLVPWRGRKVVLAFDTNVRSNNDVRRARESLTASLCRAGALVYWLAWPSDTSNQINGVDDLLVRSGRQRLLELIQTAKVPAEASHTVKVWNLAELRNASFTIAEPIIEDMLAEGETIALIGRPKAGKSRLAQQLAIDVSRGRQFLGHPISKPRKVLILDLENRPCGARARFAKMSSPSEPDDRRLFIYAPETLAGNPLTLATKDGINSLVNLVNEIRPDVLIIDTWRLLLGGDENKTEVVVAGLKCLSRLREAFPRLGTILLHHVRKQQGDNPPRLRIDPAAWVESASGHYAFVGHVDACFGLEREIDKDTGDELIVFGGVARSAAPRSLLLEEDMETLRFGVADGEDNVHKLMTGAEQKIWSSLAGLDTFTFSDAVKKANTKNRKAVASTLRKAESLQLIIRGVGVEYHRVRVQNSGTNGTS